MKAAILLICLALCCSVCVSAKGNHPLHTAKVVSQNIDSYNAGAAVMPMFGGLVGVPIVNRSNTVKVETSAYRMTWTEAGRNMITLPVNGTIEFYQDGNWYVVLDSRNHKHKFGLTHLEAIAR